MATFWDERFAGDAYYYGIQPNDWLREVAANLPPLGQVLSLGEGEGRNAVYLAAQGHAVTAVDSSEVGLTKARNLAKQRGVPLTTVLHDLAAYPLQAASWDGIISIFCHLPPPLRMRVHRDCVAALKPRGVFILEAYTSAQLHHGSGGPRNLELLYNLDGLRAELAGLHWQAAYETERWITEGEGHNGLSAVVRVLAVK